MKKALCLFFVLASVSCNGPVEKTNNRDGENSSTVYAEKYSFLETENYTLVEVEAPWQNASKVHYTYILGKNDSLVPDSLAAFPFIEIPVKNVVLMSTTYIPFIDTLNELESIIGISGGQFVFNESLQNLNPREVGYEQSLNYELLIDLNPDVVFLYGVQSGISETIRKMGNLGITAVVCADYLEPEPLGRSEWIKFFGLFYEKHAAAEAIFEAISLQYENIKSTVSGLVPPTVFLGLPWKDTWYIAGGNSYAAHLIEDAGGVYIWNDLESAEAVPYDIEAVFARALDADYWINPGIAGNMQDILDHDQRFEAFKAFQEGRVFNNNKRTSSGGGNDYWESGILHPEILLRDLNAILTDSLPNEDELFYYKLLK